MTTAPSPDSGLAAAFDSLLASRRESLSLAEEYSLVAAFTRGYLRALLGQDDTTLTEILAANLQLHAQARIFESRGIDPAEALQRRMRQGDHLGLVLRDYADHLGALDCLLDVRATAALVHLLLRLPVADTLPREVCGCEFGAGSGILSIAASIPFLAAGKRLTIHAFERDGRSCRDIVKIAELLRRQSAHGEQLTIHVHQGDVTDDAPFRQVAEATADSGPLALWLSETFGHRSRKPLLDIAGNSCTFTAPSGLVPYSADQEKRYDPFPEVLSRSCRHFPGLLAGIADGTILAFPDLVTPRVILDGTNSALLGADNVWRKLHQIGAPYTMLPPCVPSRWFLEEPKIPATTTKKAGPGRKKRG